MGIDDYVRVYACACVYIKWKVEWNFGCVHFWECPNLLIYNIDFVFGLCNTIRNEKAAAAAPLLTTKTAGEKTENR